MTSAVFPGSSRHWAAVADTAAGLCCQVQVEARSLPSSRSTKGRPSTG